MLRFVSVFGSGGGKRGGGREAETHGAPSDGLTEVHLEGEQQRGEDLQPAAGERRTVLLRSDQRHGESKASLTSVMLNKQPRFITGAFLHCLCLPAAWSIRKGFQPVRRPAQQQTVR